MHEGIIFRTTQSVRGLDFLFKLRILYIFYILYISIYILYIIISILLYIIYYFFLLFKKVEFGFQKYLIWWVRASLRPQFFLNPVCGLYLSPHTNIANIEGHLRGRIDG